MFAQYVIRYNHSKRIMGQGMLFRGGAMRILSQHGGPGVSGFRYNMEEVDLFN